MQTINPAITESPNDTPLADLPQYFSRARKAFETWSSGPVDVRISMIGQVIQNLEQRLEEGALLLATEMGKPIRLARNEITRTIAEMEYTVENGHGWLTPEPASGGEVRFDPLGVVGVISPWNFPYLLPLRAIVPALVAGNTVIFKPSELTPRCGVFITSLFSHLPADVLNTIYGGRETGALLVKQPLSLIAFTGSVRAGKMIAAQAGADLKRVILELGGLDAAIVLKDTKIETTAKELVALNAQNSGQVCNAVKRVYVEREIYKPLVAAMKSESERLKLGNPTEESTDMGPLISKEQFERVRSFAEDAIRRGAVVESGGIPEAGNYFPHTLLSSVHPESLLLQEEPFGPLLPVIPVDSIDEAIREANGTSFGLMSSIWTSDPERAKALIPRLDSGLVGINTHRAGPPGTPWGGVKESGIGRMKTKDGFREFTNIKFVAVAQS